MAQFRELWLYGARTLNKIPNYKTGANSEDYGCKEAEQSQLETK